MYAGLGGSKLYSILVKEGTMATVNQVFTELKGLTVRLYGEGADKGDIPEIKEHLINLNGTVTSNRTRSLTNSFRVKVIWAVGTAVLFILASAIASLCVRLILVGLW